ncbi:macro domain-containing protein [Endozoicomonas sp. YOMI1]|uniref:type II toxin-antitoxin system antitoxin DNA ADP-ribosyl glycohydrolase DarG n=1 Tax=Endozoicomonas sp. YOMI1 TaxID=2828739 RepID=UPI002148685A|nr:macro domain-containing protein [Endozoicomonas sp. YOMI1]
MITYTTGNLLDSQAEALVNTVNTVGVMGKGIALMFSERFKPNLAAYKKACKTGEVRTGKMFTTETGELMGPRWIINFPTKQNWRHPSQMKWIIDGLQDLKRVIIERQIHSIAIPPLGAGNGGLNWADVKRQIQLALADLTDVEIIIYEPTERYQNVAKPQGVKSLTPARALVAELIRRYWVLGMECSLIEAQKLAWILNRVIDHMGLENPLGLHFNARNYGPYADELRHLLNHLDGSYLHCDRRINDSRPFDVITFDESKRQAVTAYLKSEAKVWLPALEKTTELIDGFESPFGMELLSTVDWLVFKEGIVPEPDAILNAMGQWPAGERWALRKTKLFDGRTIDIALKQLARVDLRNPSV